MPNPIASNAVSWGRGRHKRASNMPSMTPTAALAVRRPSAAMDGTTGSRNRKPTADATTSRATVPVTRDETLMLTEFRNDPYE